MKRMLVTSFFGDGWGDQETFHKLLALRASYKHGVNHTFQDRSNLQFQVKEEKSNSKHVKTYSGSFISPLYHEHKLIPAECQECRFHLILPAQWEDVGKRRVCLHYAATGDHSFWRRYRFLAYPLAKDYNIGSVIVENPFYGRSTFQLIVLLDLHFFAIAFTLRKIITTSIVRGRSHITS